MDKWYPRVTSLSQQRMEPCRSRRVLGNAMAVDRSPVGVTAMQKLLLVTALAAMTLLAPLCAVKGQSDTEPAIAPASRTVNLTAEQRFIIKEIVYKDLKVPKAPAGAPETIGDRVPADVELHDMTAELAKKVPSAKSHKFYVTADAIVLVSPTDRTVADVIK